MVPGGWLAGSDAAENSSVSAQTSKKKTSKIMVRPRKSETKVLLVPPKKSQQLQKTAP